MMTTLDIERPVGLEEKKPSRIPALLPDRGDRYLSTNLFRSVCAECPP